MEMAYIIVAISAILLIRWAVGFARGMKRASELGKIVEAEMRQLESLGSDEAGRRAEELIKSKAFIQRWHEQPPLEIAGVLARLNPELIDFFYKYKKVLLPETDIELSSEFLTEPSNTGSRHTIGRSRSDDCRLEVAELQPDVFEIGGGVQLKKYPSLYHFILMAEDEG